MATINININDRNVDVEQEMSILAAAQKAGIYIPNLCNHPDLTPLSQLRPDMACQLCLVEVNGQMVLSCDTKTTNGMIIRTDTPEIQEKRRRILTDILRRHPNACLTCWRKEHCGPSDICLRSVSPEERCVLCPSNKRCDLQKVFEHVGANELSPSVNKRKVTPCRKSLHSSGLTTTPRRQCSCIPRSSGMQRLATSLVMARQDPERRERS